MALTDTGQAQINQLPVDFHLMKMLLRTASANAPFYGPTMPGQLMMNAGTRSVKWERIENLDVATDPLPELTGNYAGMAFQNREPVIPTITPVTASMLKYGNAIALPEELELFSVNARAAKFMKTLGENAGRTLNHVLADIYATASNTRFANKVNSAGDIITSLGANDIRAAVNFVNRNDGLMFHPQITGGSFEGSSPVRPSWLGICHSDVEEDIRLIPNFISSERYGGYTQLMPGEFGAVGGVRWISTSLDVLISPDAGGAAGTNNLRFTTDNTSADVYDSYVLGMEAIGSVGLGENHSSKIYKTGDRIPAVDLIQHMPKTNGISDLYQEIYAVAWKSWMTGTVLNNDWVVRVRTGAGNNTI